MSEEGDEPDWRLEGTALASSLSGLPSKIHEMHETDRYAVFSDGERLLLVPDEEVNP